MLEKSFEVYLGEICFEENPTVLDDDMPDFFANWEAELSEFDRVNYQIAFNNEQVNDELKRILAELKEIRLNTAEALESIKQSVENITNLVVGK